MDTPFEILLVATPGLEVPLAEEAHDLGLNVTGQIPGGVTITGDWPEVWRANLMLRGATRVLARIGAFRAMHLAQLDKRAHKFPWGDVLHPGTVCRVETTCRKSRIYHAGAATQRIETALKETIGAVIDKTAELVLKVRIEDDLATFSLDTSGASLHKRDHKQAVNKAPMRETLAAMFLRQCGYTGTEPVYDPMCGSGTFVIEAAEIAMGLAPGRSRAFGFQDLASFDPIAWARIQDSVKAHATPLVFHGSDRDAGAIRMSIANGERAGVIEQCRFTMMPVTDILPPDGPPGLVIVNPPYGGRIGNKRPLYGLYATMGERLLAEFKGWRVGVITSEAGLARATGLPFAPAGPHVNHGGIRVRLYQTPPLR